MARRPPEPGRPEPGRPEPGRPEPGRPEPRRIERLRALLDSRGGHLLVRLTAAAVVFLVAGLVMRQARAHAYRMPEFRVAETGLRFRNLPAWADGRVRWALQPSFFRPFSVSIYDPDAEALVRARVQEHPLVRRVREVRLLYPDRAEVVPELRRPVARVLVWTDRPRGGQERTTRLLSEDGCLLPRLPYRAWLEALPYDLPTVVGIREHVPLEPGEVWEDGTQRVEEAVAAARLTDRIHRATRGRVMLVGVDVSRFPAPVEEREKGEVRLVLSCPPEGPGGPRVERTVEWGRTDRARHEVPWEDDDATKIERLVDRLAGAGRPGARLEHTWLDVR